MKATQICSIDGCGRPHSCRGYCHTHYLQLRAQGRLDKKHPMPLEERFMGNVMKTPGGHWWWTGGLGRAFAGQQSRRGRALAFTSFDAAAVF